MKSTIAALLLTSSASVFADPSIFGLELGSTSEESFKSKYTHINAGVNKYSNGNMYEVPPAEVNFDGLNELTVIFDINKKLVGVLTNFPKNKFEYLHATLKKKYQQTSQKIPFVGNKSASFRDGETEITIDSPHMSFSMSMNYIRDDLQNAFELQSKLERLAKESSESAQL